MTPESEFTVDVRLAGEAVVVAPCGEIDLATVDQVRAALARRGPGTLVLDLRDVDFLDSSGLTMILEEHRRAAQEGYRFVLGAGPPSVQRLFEMTGLTDRLTFVDPRAETSGDGEPGVA